MDKINYLIMLKSNISYFVSIKCGKIQIDSSDDLPIEKKQLIKSAFNENYDHY